MSKQKHIRKILVIGIVENVNDKEEFSLVMKLQPKWLDENNVEKIGKPISIEVFFDDQESIDKYKSFCKVGNILQIESYLKNYRWQESDGIKKKRVVVGVSKYESVITVLNIKKESDMPYLNKVFILGNCYKATIRSTSDGRLMGIFPIVIKKSYIDKATGETVNNDEWLDIFVFNEKLLSNFSIGEILLENKMALIECQLQTSNTGDKNTLVVAKRNDNKFILLDIERNYEGNGNKSEVKNKTSSYKNNSINLEDDDLPF
jgi:single-stranded DNA-binding protein